ncbi:MULTISPECIES: hypothetical protein [Methylobacterium]|uniref:Uncharacterized protein n=1 Tax=Methylobacterium thuringiense TaxID=1003091 RepID=A0ABQ4TQ83_9HYPH|nr:MULTISPECIES: hypothetical protein [Methylobacterium]TXN21974.1 hypothetical protein FV217_12545 [Methylobacterium sp. WL9]GJE56822.1 hypothetical protein EKPJFOCH_3330 [Methylobacterium thuringiense]
MLAARSIASGTYVGETLSRGGVSVLATGADAFHRHDVTWAWTEFSIKDMLSCLPERYVRDPETVASITPLA